MSNRSFEEYLSNVDMRNSMKKRVKKSVARFEKYLEKVDKTLDDARPSDLDEFLNQYTRKYVSTFYVQDLGHYYAANGNKEMQKAVDKMKYKYTAPYRLEELNNIKKDHLNALEKLGIKTNNQLLYACKSESDRKELAAKAEIPLEVVTKLVKMSDLTRIFAVKATRAQLYYEAGLDSVEKIAAIEPEELVEIVTKYVKESNFNGVPTLPKEAESTVNFARKLVSVD